MSVLVPELLAVVSGLSEKPAEQDSEFPFVLSAGERRAFTANTIMRDPTWRRREAAGDLRMSQGDADRMGINSGDRVVLTTRCGQAEVTVQTTGTMRPGHLALPNGFGLTVDGQRTGIAPNDLTRTADRDEFVGTPWHKHVPARVEKVVG